MRHVKGYKELFENQTELSQEQIEWLDECTRGKWTLNPQTGLVDVDGGFYCSDQHLTDFKGVIFGVVTEYFDCSNNQLISLEGAPQKVGGSFYCYDNQLTSLEGAPQQVEGDFDCSNNQLTSLDGAPSWVGGSLYCSDNPVSEWVLGDIHDRMRSGMSWPDAVVEEWDFIKSDEDQALLAPYNHTLSPEDVKGYQALARLRRRVI
jgi:hypothetical protein